MFKIAIPNKFRHGRQAGRQQADEGNEFARRERPCELPNLPMSMNDEKSIAACNMGQREGDRFPSGCDAMASAKLRVEAAGSGSLSA